MNDNLIFYINKLSYIIVTRELEKEGNRVQGKKSDTFFKNCVKKIKQKGCDVLLNRGCGAPIQDPCITDYGGNWSPLTLITDYGRELEAQGAGKQNDLLLSCIATLQEKPYDCVNILLKLLLLLKRPLEKEPLVAFQNELSLNNSDFILDRIESFSFITEDFSNDCLSNCSSYRRVLHYEESWTKHFDSKFQLLGEFSKKNLQSADKVSLKSIFSSKAIISSPSRTSSFGFTDFFYDRNYKSEKSLFDINSNTYVNENPLLDSFVDRPIPHKLPSLKLNTRYSCKSGFLEKSSVQLSNPSSSEDQEAKENEDDDDVSRKTSVIKLKRNSNCSHSFSILYDKSMQSQCWALGSNDTISNSKKDFQTTSKEIILGLWEQEQSLIREFKPELAISLPSLRMITLAEFIEDVKYLLTGINSETFKYDTERNGFDMVYGTCLDDVTPESLFHFSNDFMEVGDCYVKLISRVYETGKNSFDTCTTISQAFWKSVFDYLEIHYSLVLEIPISINLMALKSCTRDMHEIMKTIANICKVHKNEALPQGGALLTYLLEFAETISKECVVNIVYGIVRNCSNVYMCILQDWMFKGQLDIQSNEFFVVYGGRKMKARSRSYYNSFFLNDEKIPNFLRGYEDSFFNCGKSVHFLRLFNPEDAFCQLLEKGEYPTMKIYFTDDQLEKLETDFKSYEETVMKQCGERITIRMLRNEELERERNYQEYVASFKKGQEKQREEALLQERKEMKMKKDEQNKLLTEKRSLIEAEKERKREEERMEKLKFEADVKEANEARENLLNKEKNVLKKTYSDLIENLERGVMVSEARKESLKKIIEGTTENLSVSDVNDNLTSDNISDVINDNVSFVTIDNDSYVTTENVSDVINANEIHTDEEGNIMNQLYANSKENSLVLGKDEDLPFTKDNSLGNNYDENLNPCVENEKSTRGSKTKVEKEVRKSVSYRTVAAEEAEKNKQKILKSEFGVPVKSEPNTSEKAKPRGPMRDLERNRQKVLQSEYNILLKHVSPSTCSQNSLEVVSDRESGTGITEDNSSVNGFATVMLERKQECMDLKRPAEKSVAQSQSSESYLTSSNDFSMEIASNASEEIDNKSGSITLSDKYLDALSRDSDIFKKKSSHQDIFGGLKDNEKAEEEIESLPCTDFLKFQRCLRKSALTPLKIQEKLANDALLKHILKGENLLAHLDSLRRYFFLNDGEFGRSFTHQIFRSLAKCTEPNQFFERSNLSNIVNEALNYTIHSSEPNSQFLSFRIVNMPPYLNHSSHDVLSPFELSYKVDWPLNLILTEKALSKYKMVFRFLLKLKRIKWTLNESFLFLNYHFKNKKLNGKILVGSPHYHKIQMFRHAITQVMITLDDYIFSNGIQFSWIYFLKDLETTENIDHLYQKHVRYIKDVLTRCFLSKNSEDLLNCIHNLIELALKFHYTVKCSAMVLADGRYEHPKFQVLKTTFNEFCSIIKTFLKSLKEKISSNEVMRSHYVLIEKFDLKLT